MLLLPSLPPSTSSQLLLGPGDASGGAGSRGGDPQRLLHETRQILEPVCPSLRPLLRGLAGNNSPPGGLAAQPSSPSSPTTPEPSGLVDAPADAPPPRDGGLAAAGGAEVGGGGATTAAGSLDQEPEAGDADGVGSVLDYGGDGSLAVAGAPGGGVLDVDVLQGADGLFKENKSGGAREEVFDRPVQSSAPTALSTGRPQIV